MIARKVFFGAGLLAAALPEVAHAAVASTPPASHPANFGTALALLVAAPFVALLLACYVKIAVVLSVLRAALGGALPPRSVNAAVAVLLTAFVMAPVADKAWTAAAPALARADASTAPDSALAVAGPARDFLLHHADPREQKTFFDLARRLRPPAERDAVTDRDLAVLAPAFIVGELKSAFQIGFLLLLPFLVLDLVISSLLTTLGMYSLDPRAVALPFKLLLFVLADGWHLVARGLLLSYA